MFNTNVLNCIHHFQSRWWKVSIAQNTSSLEEPAQMNGSQSHQEHTSLFCIQPPLALYTSRLISDCLDWVLSLSLSKPRSSSNYLLIPRSLIHIFSVTSLRLSQTGGCVRSQQSNQVNKAWLQKSVTAQRKGCDIIRPQTEEGKQPAPNTDTTQPQTNANDSELKQRSTRKMKTLI